MSIDIPALLERPGFLLPGLVLGVIVLLWIAARVRRIARSPRPDDALANLAMLIGLGWSSEAIWEITQERLHFPIGLTLLLFFVLESLLLLAMMRAKRHVEEFGWPGRFGTTAWIVASAMATVGAFASDSVAEAVLRMAIPLLVTKQWWDGVAGGNAKRPNSATSWRWTPRRLLLWVGAIEPGERDVDTVNRERLTQTMTRLEFRRRHGSARRKVRAAGKLARLSLTADDDIIDEVRRRADRATWFEPTHEEPPVAQPKSAILASAAASAKRHRVRHRHLIRRVRVTHPGRVVVAAQEPRQDLRSTQDRDLVIRAIKDAHPAFSQRHIALLAATSEPTVRSALRRTKAAGAPPITSAEILARAEASPDFVAARDAFHENERRIAETPINGREPELVGTGHGEKEN